MKSGGMGSSSHSGLIGSMASASWIDVRKSYSQWQWTDQIVIPADRVAAVLEALPDIAQLSGRQKAIGRVARAVDRGFDAGRIRT